MNELQIFNNPEFGEVRIITENGKTLFCGSDVARALGYKRPADAITTHCKGSVIRRLPTKGGKQDVKFIPEGDIYRLAAKSELPGSEKFESWIFDEVLPTIRKTGAYSTRAMPDSTREKLADAKARNARARAASIWVKLAQFNPVPTYQQICAHYASAELMGGDGVLPLPEVKEHTYSAEEVGRMLGGVSSNMIGRLANQNGMKTEEYAVQVWDKAKHSEKQVPVWRYNQKAIDRFKELLR